MRIRIGTRGSCLARTQTAAVAARLERLGHEVETVVIETLGDRDKESSFASIGAAGIFVREIERALIDGQIDLAVHSYKDLPATQPDDLEIVATPERLDPSDVLLVRPEAFAPQLGLLPVDRGCRVGTSAARREAQLRGLRPDLRPKPLRGNVDTRIRKLMAGDYDAIVIAAAGLLRLQRRADQVPDGLARLVRQPLDPLRFVPAPTQGALALQARAADEAVRDAVQALRSPELERVVAGERRLLALVEGSCDLPFGALCREITTDDYELVCVLGGRDGLEFQHLRGRSPRLLADLAWDRFAAMGFVAS